MKNLAIITARGGSKRIPKKNIKIFCGKPILAYSIQAALESKIFDTVMVSTDSEEIAEIAREYNAEVPFIRSAAVSNDFSTTADVIVEVLACYAEQNIFYDNFCCLYPTAPFVTPEKLNAAYAYLLDEGVDSVLAVMQFSFPPQRGFVSNEKGFVNYAYPEYAKSRSQDLPPIFHDCGQFYFNCTQPFLNRKSLVSERTKPFFISELEAQDIDTQDDWEIAEIKYKLLCERGAKK